MNKHNGLRVVVGAFSPKSPYLVVSGLEALKQYILYKVVKVGILMEKGIQRINPSSLYDPSPNGYTHVVMTPAAGIMVYIAGQGGEDENGNLVNDFGIQVKQAFTNLRTALAAAGARPENVVKMTTLVVDHSESKLQQLTSQVHTIWGDKTPAQTLIPVPRLALDGMLFEVDAVAVIPNSEP